MQSTNTAQRVGREVKARMVLTGTRQAEIANALGLSQAAVSRRLSGEVPFDVSELQAVAERLGVSASSLLTGTAVAEAVA